MENNILFKRLNLEILGNKHVDKNPNEYLYASLTQPPIKIISKNNSKDELDWLVECPNCKSIVNYGTEIFMISGHLYCNNEGCREDVIEKYCL